jgi:REP element-mobilizing transposase RayT
MENQIQLSESFTNQLNSYEHYQHSVGVMIMHLEWCTKYRYKMFQKQEYLKLAEACIRKAAFEHEIKIIKLSVMPEHIHCVVQVSLSFSASKCLQILKGYSSYFSLGYIKKQS